MLDMFCLGGRIGEMPHGDKLNKPMQCMGMRRRMAKQNAGKPGSCHTRVT